MKKKRQQIVGIFMRNMKGSGECRDARPVRPLNQPCAFVFYSPWADARTVRPYIRSPTILRGKMHV